MHKKSSKDAFVTFIFVFKCFFCTVTLFAQPPDTTWIKRYRPVGFMGMTAITEGFDGLQLPDGGYIACGVTMNPWLKGYIVRTNSNGDTLWTKQYFSDITTYGSFTANDIERTSSGDFIVSGYGSQSSNSGIYILKLNSSGNITWVKFFTKGSIDTTFVTHDMILAPDGGIVITGLVKEDMIKPNNAFVLKYSSTGNFEWYRKIGTDFSFDEGHSIENAWDSGFICVSTYDSTAIDLIKIIKLDNSGNIQWTKILHGGPNNIGNNHMCLKRTNDNNYIIVGEENMLGVLIMKIDADGDSLWSNNYSFETVNPSGIWVDATNDGGYVLTATKVPDGLTEPWIWVIKTDGNGDKEWELDLPFYGLGDYAYRIEQTSDNGYILFGRNRVDSAGIDYLLMVKLGGTVGICPDHAENTGFRLDQNYPNPFNSLTRIEFLTDITGPVSLSVFDINGNELKSFVENNMPAGKHYLIFIADGLVPGLYYYRLESGGKSVTMKMISVGN